MAAVRSDPDWLVLVWLCLWLLQVWTWMTQAVGLRDVMFFAYCLLRWSPWPR